VHRSGVERAAGACGVDLAEEVVVVARERPEQHLGAGVGLLELGIGGGEDRGVAAGVDDGAPEVGLVLLVPHLVGGGAAHGLHVRGEVAEQVGVDGGIGRRGGAVGVAREDEDDLHAAGARAGHDVLVGREVGEAVAAHEDAHVPGAEVLGGGERRDVGALDVHARRGGVGTGGQEQQADEEEGKEREASHQEAHRRLRAGA
jgi:hypothetical protein